MIISMYLSPINQGKFCRVLQVDWFSSISGIFSFMTDDHSIPFMVYILCSYPTTIARNGKAPWRFSMNFLPGCPWMSWLTMLRSVHARKAGHQPASENTAFRDCFAEAINGNKACFCWRAFMQRSLTWTGVARVVDKQHFSIDLQQVMAAWTRYKKVTF